MDRKPERLDYCKTQYPFDRIVADHFGIAAHKLYQIHEWLDEEVPFFADKSFDQGTAIHKHFYDLYEQEEFLQKYRQLLSSVVKPQVFNDKPIIYQAKPTFRVCLPDNVAVGEWHRDKDYNHQDGEVTFMLPLTAAFDTNTVWAESEPDKGDYAPLEANVGEVLAWDSVNLFHGNKPNATGKSRMSVDFRVIAESGFKAGCGATSNKALGLEFEVGSYYEAM